MTVSVIIPTWKRHDLLFDRAIPSVLAQTTPVECIVVSDGPDPELRELTSNLDVVYTEVEQHQDHPTNVGGWARNQGLEVATGAFIAYLDDDNSFRPSHIECLTNKLIENETADFAYSQMIRHGIGDVVGADPPEFGMIDSSLIMHRADTHLKFGKWPAPSRYDVDWQLIEKWISAGAKWAHLPIVTVDYYYRPR